MELTEKTMIFDVDKQKTLHTQIKVDNIDEEDINWIFRIVIEGVEYGFGGTLLDDGRVRFVIPPLSTVVSKNMNPDKNYAVMIDAIANEKFYQKAWESTAQIKAVPKLEMKEVIEDNLEEVKGSEVSVIKIEDSDAEKIVQRFKDAEKEVLKKDPEIEVPEEKKPTSDKFSKFIRGIKDLSPEESLKKLLGEVREKKDDSKED